MTRFKIVKYGTSSNECSIFDLPDEILLQILSYLDTFTLSSKISLVCRTLNEVSQDLSLWKSISFKGNGSMCHIPKVLAKYNQVLHLSIERSVLNSSIFKAISLLSRLERLSFTECTSFIGSVVSFNALINSSHCLTSLEVIKCWIDNKIFDSICNAKSLKRLNMTYIENERLIQILENCEKLEHLEIRQIDHISEEAIEQIFRLRSSTLVSLVLNGEKSLSDTACTYIESCSKLQRVSFCRCSSMTDQTLRRVQKLPDILDLNLAFGSKFTAVGFKELFGGKSMAELTHLDLTRCTNFDDVCLVIVADKCRKLKNLRLNSCLKLTDESIRQMAQKCASLLSLDVSWIDQLRGLFLPALQEHSRDLKILDIRMCRGIESKRIKNLSVSRLSLKIYTHLR